MLILGRFILLRKNVMSLNLSYNCQTMNYAVFMRSEHRTCFFYLIRMLFVNGTVFFKRLFSGCSFGFLLYYQPLTYPIFCCGILFFCFLCHINAPPKIFFQNALIMYLAIKYYSIYSNIFQSFCSFFLKTIMI